MRTIETEEVGTRGGSGGVCRRAVPNTQGERDTGRSVADDLLLGQKAGGRMEGADEEAA